MSEEGRVEELDKLTAPIMDMHRAIQYLREKLDALDRCNQRYEACTDPELKLVLAHHRDHERKDAAMLIEWMRRRDTRLNTELKEAMFKAGPIAAPFHYDEEAP